MRKVLVALPENIPELLNKELVGKKVASELAPGRGISAPIC